MSKKCTVFLCALLVVMTLAGCGSKAVPQAEYVDDMRDAIAIAIDDGDEAQVKKLLEAQPLLLNAPIPNLNSATPLHCAARAGNASIVKYLLEQGANPNVVDDDGNSPYDAALAAGAGQDVIDLLQVR